MKILKLIAKVIIPKKYHTIARDLYISLLYGGNRFICPCCGWYFRKLLSAGLVPRANAECPRCGALERHRLLWLYLLNRTNIFSDSLKVLCFAPEPIFQKIFVSLPNLTYISADLESPIAMVKLDITKIPFKDESFDVILCSHVLEHVVDDRKATHELFRVLKPRGWAILQSPVDLNRSETFEDPSVVSPKDRESIFGQHDHVRIYGRNYVDRLQSAGFTVKLDSYVKELGSDVVQRYSLEENEVIYFCTKLGGVPL